MPNFDKFAELLTHYIKVRERDNAWLAKQIGVSNMTISKWRNGQVKREVNCEKVFLCAEVLKLAPDTERPEFLEVAGCKDYKPKQPDKSFPKLTDSLVPVLTRPVIHPAQFFGRYAELQIISHCWNRCMSPLHLMITGPKQGGKTSLLNYLRYFQQQGEETLRPGQPHTWLRQKFEWVFIDFEDVRMQTPGGVWQHILNSLHLPVPKDLDFSEFNRTLDEGVKRPTVIGMDKLETGLQLSSLGESFWYNLRSLGSHGGHGQLTFCVAVRDEKWGLDKILGGIASSFGNIFSVIPLEGFSKQEALELLSYAPVSFSEEETVWVLEKSQCWPVLLQMFCQMRLADETGTKWQRRGVEELKRYEYLLKWSSSWS